ncbi:VapC toxin family PIN domain ribonuclease [Carbonactinospora thermoautotrophica]|uniref:type II toxin-antitoxin system VapC family toxin n=1 Tax=Carbonactinospora thermoautotrophica TaxID=1469144 RepID=UPI00226DDDB7|nr:type II toxin-antitoxin system VapC family toxin [Carbonactinospora thermoautotrophica]MCX9191376.1 VapC toxin family PIN domain ribonuclease [Carbonactinospora thermoautotrophica]
MIYLDSCALVKLVREEDESEALRAYLDAHADVEHVTSELARAEVMRVIRRVNHDDQGRLLVTEEEFARQVADASDVLDAVSYVTLDVDLLDEAGAIRSPHVRTLDAIHLASAALLGPALTAFVTYDKRLRQAAEQAGNPVVAPG